MKKFALAAPLSEDGAGEFFEGWHRLRRWLLGLILLPLCTVTSWTFLSRFSYQTLKMDFWRTPECWYFAIGCLVMAGWLFSGLKRTLFLYLYVLGHEATHAFFVLVFRGRVIEFHIGSEGGYITTDKTNLLISLSPYFVPFWSVVVAIVFLLMGCFAEIPRVWALASYGLIGFTWTFHLFWTLWMIPRDQPDLKDNGTFLSLMVIYLANVLILVGLLCGASDSPWQTTRAFGMEWMECAVTWADVGFRWMAAVLRNFQTNGVY